MTYLFPILIYKWIQICGIKIPRGETLLYTSG